MLHRSRAAPPPDSQPQWATALSPNTRIRYLVQPWYHPPWYHLGTTSVHHLRNKYLVPLVPPLVAIPSLRFLRLLYSFLHPPLFLSNVTSFRRILTQHTSLLIYLALGFQGDGEQIAEWTVEDKHTRTPLVIPKDEL